MDEFIEVSSAAATDGAADAVCLDFRRRERTRQRATLESGEAIAIVLPRGTRLRAGDVIVSRAGRRVAVHAAPEDVSTVRGTNAAVLARVAYHLGNRHVRLQVGDGWLRYLADHVLDAMVRGLGAEPEPGTAPFEPEPGAYHSAASAPGHAHSHDHGHEHGHAH